MPLSAQEQVTNILQGLQHDRPSAAERLLPLVYDEMRRLADRYFQRERANHTLQPTALVHEAYMRLVNQTQVEWKDRGHFFAVAANAMRRILINYAEHHRAAKRGGGMHRVTLSESQTPAAGDPATDVDLLALDEALTELERLDERQCRVVELRFFSGMSVEESAAVLGISPRLVELDWKMARAWLFQRLHA